MRNQGTGASAATTLNYYRSSDATISTRDTEVGTDAVGALVASGTSAESVDPTAPSSEGSYYYGACVESVAGETDTGNNCSIGVGVMVEEPDTTPVTIPDAKLRAAIEAALGKASGATITVAEMKTLDRLFIGGQNVSDLTGLEFATNLDFLRLEFTSSITDISALAGLTNLTGLDLWRNNITDVSALAGLTNLRSLSLGYNNVTDISALAGLTNLRSLSLGYNNVTDISALSGLTNLTWLDLWGNFVTDVSALSGLTNLTLLQAPGNDITDVSALAGLTNLTHLSLSDNNVTDVSALFGLTNLTELQLSGNPITDLSMLASWLRGLTNLELLTLSSTGFTDISALAGLTNLTHLSLGGNNVTDVSALAGLTNLTTLWLGSNNITDVSALSGLTNLTYLELKGNPLNDSSINDHIPVLESRGVTVQFDRLLQRGDFDIELVFLGPFTDSQKDVFQYVARRWMSVITEDLPDYEFTQGWSGQCGDQSYEIPSGERIDDLRIYVTTFDGGGTVFGWGAPQLLRETTYLPVLGCMAFDLERANLLITGLHEAGHVLGFGPIWDHLGFLQDPSGDAHFNGPLAIAAFNDAGGWDYTGAKVPVQEMDGAHWRQSVFAGEFVYELMQPGGGVALSAITVQSLADLGYGVDVTQADGYTLPGAASAKVSAKIAAALPSFSGVDVTQADAYHLPGANPHWLGSIAGGLPSLSGDDRWRGHLAQFPQAEPALSCGAGLRQEPIHVVDPQGRIIRTLGD